MITREDLEHFSISIKDYGGGWYDSMLYYKGKLVATYPCSGHINCVINEEGMQEIEIQNTLEETVPVNLLTDEQRAEAKKLNKFDAVKYINQVTNEGLKTAKIYFDLYISDGKR